MTSDKRQATSDKLAKAKTEPLPDDVREGARKVLGELGEVAAADELGVSRLALVRAIAGMPIRNSVATTIAVNVARLSSAA